jgi:hypothetical protein
LQPIYSLKSNPLKDSIKLLNKVSEIILKDRKVSNSQETEVGINLVLFSSQLLLKAVIGHKHPKVRDQD